MMLVVSSSCYALKQQRHPHRSEYLVDIVPINHDIKFKYMYILRVFHSHQKAGHINRSWSALNIEELHEQGCARE